MRLFSIFTPLTLLGAAFSFECGGLLSDGSDAVTSGGDLDALSPPGSPPGAKCKDYDAASWASGGVCQTLSDCVDAAATLVPSGWPVESVRCVSVDAGISVCRPNDFTFETIACDGAHNGQQYCEAWAIQYARGDALKVVVSCHSAFPKAGSFCDLYDDQTKCPGCSGICVERTNGFACELPCQETGVDK